MTGHNDKDQPMLKISTHRIIFHLLITHFLPNYLRRLTQKPIAIAIAIALSSPPGEVLRPPHSATKSAVVLTSFLPMSEPPLYKQKSWSPDTYRDEAWIRRKGNCRNRRRKSFTDEDLDELKACIELGFSFDSPEVDRRLSDTLPALEFYNAVNKHYYDSVCKSSPSSTTSSECDSVSPLCSPYTIFGPGDNPQAIKMRLRQWAQVVACSVKQCLVDEDAIIRANCEAVKGLSN